MDGITLADAALFAAAAIAGVGTIVLSLELCGVARWLARQPEREARYLANWPVPDDGDLLIDDASRDDAFDSFTGTIDEFKAIEAVRTHGAA